MDNEVLETIDDIIEYYRKQNGEGDANE